MCFYQPKLHQDPERKEVLRPLKMSNKRGSKAGTSLAMNEARGNRAFLASTKGQTLNLSK